MPRGKESIHTFDNNICLGFPCTGLRFDMVYFYSMYMKKFARRPCRFARDLT